MPSRTDIIASLVIGEIAALLMVAISWNLDLPSGPQAAVRVLPFVFPAFTLVVMIIGNRVGQRIRIAYQFSKFVLVGGQNFLIDLGILNLFIALTGISSGVPAGLFKAVAFLVGNTSSFLWNKFWTFRSLSTDHVGMQAVEFFIVSAIGLGINVSVFALVNDAIGPQGGVPPKAWATVAAGGAAIAGLLWNFVGYKFLVFKRR